jgi:hypothetical protein
MFLNLLKKIFLRPAHSSLSPPTPHPLPLSLHHLNHARYPYIGRHHLYPHWTLFSVENKKIQFLISNQFFIFAQYKQKQRISYHHTHSKRHPCTIHLSMVYKWNYSDKITSSNLKAIKPGSGRKQSTLKALSGWIKRCERRHPCKLRVPTV